jgi:hypothetical protein
MAVSAICGFKVWSMDMTQAYLQSAVPLLRDVYLKPDVLELSDDELVRLRKPLYGLSDSGDYWHHTITRFHQALDFKQSAGDFAFYYQREADKLLGLSSTFVDDILQAGTDKFRMNLVSALKQGFDIKGPELTPLTFAGLEVCQYSLSQAGYIGSLTLLADSSTYEDFRSARAKLAWVVQTRPDIACAVALAAQDTATTFGSGSVKRLNDVTKHLKRTQALKLNFPQMDRESLQLVVYADSSFGNCHDSGTQIGYIMFLMDKLNNASVITFRSYKARRVVRSSTAGETLALADSFDSAFVIRHDLQAILGRKVPLLLLTDSESLFYTLTRDKYTRERRLLLDIAAVRNAYKSHEISNIGLIDSVYNLADPLTKVKSGVASDALLNVIKTGKIDHPIRCWVIERDLRSLT